MNLWIIYVKNQYIKWKKKGLHWMAPKYDVWKFRKLARHSGTCLWSSTWEAFTGGLSEFDPLKLHIRPFLTKQSKTKPKHPTKLIYNNRNQNSRCVCVWHEPIWGAEVISCLDWGGGYISIHVFKTHLCVLHYIFKISQLKVCVSWRQYKTLAHFDLASLVRSFLH